MKINRETVIHVATLARLKLTEAEIKKFVPQLEEVMDMFSVIDKADVNAVKPSFQPIPLKNVVREDTPQPCLTQEQALSNTEHKKDGYFKGPKIV